MDLPLRERIDQTRVKYANDPFRLAQEYKKLLKEAEKIEDICAIGKVHLYLSICYFYQGRRDSTLPHAFKAVSIFETLDECDLLARSYNLLGVAYAAQGNFLNAIAVYQKALKLIRGRKKVGIRKETLLNNIAQCYSQMGQYQKSVQLVKECLAVVRAKRPNLHTAVVIYGINLSDFYENLGDLQASIEYLDEVKSDVEELSNGVIRWGYYARRCCVLYRLGRLEEASKYADMTVEAVRSGCDSYEGHIDFERIAALQVEIGDFQRAQCFSDILSKYADEIGHTLDQIISKRVRANICYAKGDFDGAYALYRELSDLNEDWITEQKTIQYESQRRVDTASKEISMLMKKIRMSEEQAERDSLTGLLNRSVMVSVTNGFLQEAREKGEKLGGIFLDIDYFKEYNDAYGHTAGDEAIKLIARVCQEEESPDVKFFRYGGDEFFGIVLGHKDDFLKKLVLRIADKVHQAGCEHIKNPNGQRLTVSIGVVNVDVTGTGASILEIIQFADQALYHAKDAGRDAVCAVRVMAHDTHEFSRIM